MRREDITVLQPAGITPEEETVYQLLVAAGVGTAASLAPRTGLGVAATEDALLSLTAKGLADHGSTLPRQFRAAPPDVALLPRLQRSTDALEQARLETSRLIETYRDTMRRHDAVQLLEVITGAEALRQHLRRIQDGARHEVLWFCKPQYIAMPSGSNKEEFAALARGVRYRVVYETAFFEEEGAVDNVTAAVEAGEQARVSAHLPLRLAVADGSVALLPLVSGGSSGSPEVPTTALVRDSNLLGALIALFECYWAQGVPLDRCDSDPSDMKTPPGPSGLSPTDHRLLSLLVAGVADKAIASHLNLSRRTVQRRLQALMERAGAANRVQLAWQAARRGWL
ncbi:LuxR C-terminal-related transcriptional regulator [Streptomyces bauhiniae]|uniref:LuxR C-terminal-related transcriptional regulator n=1 Tax=Streptomyces bauhiniae TaxID=2340725 RepID=UPI0035D8262F